MENWTELDKSTDDRVWKKIYKDFKFNPSIYKENWPSFHAPKPYITYDISGLYGTNFTDLYKNLEENVMRAFLANTSPGEFIFALDWQHPSFWFNPRMNSPSNESRKWLITLYPDGDYYFFIRQDFSWGYLGHPWEKSICVFGNNLIKEIEVNKPVIFSKVLRESF